MAQSDIYTDHSRLPNVPFTFKALQTITGVGIGCGVGIGIGRAMELRSLPIVGPALGGSGELNRAFQSFRGPVRNAIIRLGFKQLNAGIGCGVGIGHGFGIGLALKPEMAARASEALKDNLSKWMARFESRTSTPPHTTSSAQPTSSAPSAAIPLNQASLSSRGREKLTAKDLVEAEIADSDILKLILIKLLRQEAVNEALKQIVIEDVEPHVAFSGQGVELSNGSSDTSKRRKCFKCRRKGRLR